MNHIMAMLGRCMVVICTFQVSNIKQLIGVTLCCVENVKFLGVMLSWIWEFS